MNNFCHTFLAKGVRKVAEPHLEIPEYISIHLLSREDVEKLLITVSIIESIMQTPLWKYLKDN